MQCAKFAFLFITYQFEIFISREWTENGQLWIQQVSSTPATRMDVVNLQVRNPLKMFLFPL